ncbi:MAG: diadenylate cyclase [Desulfobacterales bacterium]
MGGFVSFFSGIGWLDIVDILLNSYILFRLYVLFRGTKTFRVLVGIAFLWFLQRAAFALGLVLFSWAIQGITAAGALIVIIVFRNEIRSVFQATDLKSIFWGIPGKVYGTPVEIIVESMFELARKRIGALLVIPGNDDLDEYLNNGIDWQGVVSKEMLLSIFFPDNPVHDGATVIKGGRVEKVGVILPLSERTDLPSYLGTRHRAALGLSERTDALVLLASEERGEVVAAKDRGLEVFYHPRGLEETLNIHLGLSTKEEQELLKQRRDLITAGVLSFSFVFITWYSITRGSDTLVALEVPIEYIKSDPEVEIVESSTNTVRLHVSGSSFLIKSIRPGQVRVRVNISETTGRKQVDIPLDAVSLPPGVLLKKVEPSEVTVFLTKSTVKKIPVQAHWIGKLPDHLIMTESAVTPQAIKVAGKSHLLKDLDTVYTEKIPLDNIRRSGRISARVILDSPALSVASGENRVTVEYRVQERDN